VAAGLLLVPWAAGLVATPPAAFLAVAAGIGAGALARRVVAVRRQARAAASRHGSD
jgi:hypothetical protein